MSPLISLVVDGVVAALLVATIVYAVILNRQITRLRDSRSELADLIRGLNDATANAEAAVRGLRKAAGETGEQLQRAVDKGGALRDELQFMIESGNALADRLGGASTGMGDKARHDHHTDMRSVDNMRTDARPRAPSPPPMQPGPMRNAPSARPPIDEGLMAAARAEAARHNPGGGGAPPASRGGSGGGSGGGGSAGGEGDGLSRAERELLQALESRR